MSTALAPVNIETEIEQSDSPGALLDTMLARLEYDMELANTTEEANEIRARIEAVKTYAKRKLPAVMKDRAQRFQYTFHAGKDYILASAKAGAYWNTLGDRRPNGGASYRSENFQTDISQYTDWQAAGFRHPRDATTCGRIAQLHNEDLRTYFDECESNLKEPTLYGAERVWHEFYKTPHVANNSGENEWYTPSRYIDAAREVMGNIDLDPASSELANEVVQADKIYTIEDNGLDYQWRGKVWMNPPYDKELIPVFVDKLVGHAIAGDITESIVLVNNATETAWFRKLVSVASAVAFSYSRVKYWRPDGEMNTPLQGQAFVYIGSKPKTFKSVFSDIGWVAFVENES